jgi:hypothetical protein
MTEFRRSWWSLAISSKAFFCVALSHAAGDCDLTLRKGDSVEAIAYRTEAMRIVNERLGMPQHLATDETISAVAALANYEVCKLHSMIFETRFLFNQLHADLLLAFQRISFHCRDSYARAAETCAVKRRVRWRDL